MGVNSLLTVTRQRRDCDLSPGLLRLSESSMLTTQLSSHPHYFPHYSSSNDTTAIYLDALIVDFFRSLDLSRLLSQQLSPNLPDQISTIGRAMAVM